MRRLVTALPISFTSSSFFCSLKTAFLPSGSPVIYTSFPLNSIPSQDGPLPGVIGVAVFVAKTIVPVGVWFTGVGVSVGFFGITVAVSLGFGVLVGFWVPSGLDPAFRKGQLEFWSQVK